MIPFGNAAATLVQRVEERVDGRSRVHYEKHGLSGCSWRRVSSCGREDSYLQRDGEIRCRIPAGQAIPRPGDCLFPGEIEGEISGSAELNALLAAQREHGAFRIASVTDNAQPGAPLPHYVAQGVSA